MSGIWKVWLVLALVAGLVGVSCRPTSEKAIYFSPENLAYSPDGKYLAISDVTACELVLMDPSSSQTMKKVSVPNSPRGLAWASSDSVYVVAFEEREVVEVSVSEGKVERHLSTGPYPMDVAVAPGRNLLVVAEWAMNQVRLIDMSSGETLGLVDVARQPCHIAVSPDESLAVASALLPDGTDDEPGFAAEISVIDLSAIRNVANIPLPHGSSSVQDVVVSSDSRWAYVVHTISRYTMPPTQLERGWVVTNALSVIDLKNKTRYGTALFDKLTQGAANPWGLAISPDGQRLYATISGASQLARVDVEQLHRLIQERGEDMVFDLVAMYETGSLHMSSVEGKGPRGVALSPDGKQVAVAAYYSGQVELIDVDTSACIVQSLGAQPVPDPARQGEVFFHDAARCYQQWLSCATCHPGDARVDALNWDSLNNGIGNSNNTRSMLWSYQTPPVMAEGVRADMETAVNAGFIHAQFGEPKPEIVSAVIAYLSELKPLASPYLSRDGSLSEAANRGQRLFNDEKVGCARCHVPPLFTDLKMHEVATDDEAIPHELDTPTLVEIWRTAPYGYKGDSATLRELLVDNNYEGTHGKTAHLSEWQVNDLIEFIKSL